MTPAFKIVEAHPRAPDTLRTLFHGYGGTRLLVPNLWLEADVKLVTDGTSPTVYQSGWHTLPTMEEAQDYLRRFTTRLDLLRIVPCFIRDCWPKAHSNANVTLSRWIMFPA